LQVLQNRGGNGINAVSVAHGTDRRLKAPSSTDGSALRLYDACPVPGLESTPNQRVNP
jgi:hypothetical protein